LAAARPGPGRPTVWTGPPPRSSGAGTTRAAGWSGAAAGLPAAAAPSAARPWPTRATRTRWRCARPW